MPKRSTSQQVPKDLQARFDEIAHLTDGFCQTLLNEEMLMFDEVIVPEGKLWKRLGPLHVYVLESEYILVLKITAGRQKDLDNCAILLPKTKIRTRK